jgi:hypothetical protein
VDDAEDEHDAIGFDDVVHDPKVANPKSMEAISKPLQGLDRLPPYPARLGDIRCELLECLPRAIAPFRIQLLEGARRDGRKLDLVGIDQLRSSREVVRPFR